MNQIYKLSIIILLTCVGQISVAQVMFQRVFAGSDMDNCFYVEQVEDGGYAFAGHTNSFGGWGSNILLVRTDENGETIWTKTYQGSHTDICYAMQHTSDGGYILTGVTFSYGAGAGDAFLIKTDEFGDTLWTKTYGTSSVETGFWVRETADGGYILTGRTYGIGDNGDMYVVRTDKNGDILWTRTYGGPSYDTGRTIVECEEGGFLVVGTTESFGYGGSDVYVVKLDDNGDVAWAKTYGGTGTDKGNFLIQADDGGYAIGGSTYSFGAGTKDGYLLKIDQQVNLLWSKTYGGEKSDFISSVHQTDDGGFMCIGSTKSFGGGDQDIYLIRVNQYGEHLWSQSYGTDDYEDGSVGFHTQDGGYILGGGRYDDPAEVDINLIKTDAQGRCVCGEHRAQTECSEAQTLLAGGGVASSGGEQQNMGCTIGTVTFEMMAECYSQAIIAGNASYSIEVTISPNPFRDEAVVTINSTIPLYSTDLLIFDISGKEVKRIENIQDSELIVQRGDMPPGLYYYKLLESDQMMKSGRILVY
jgi:hypothetical protein